MSCRVTIRTVLRFGSRDDPWSRSEASVPPRSPLPPTLIQEPPDRDWPEPPNRFRETPKQDAGRWGVTAVLLVWYGVSLSLPFSSGPRGESWLHHMEGPGGAWTFLANSVFLLGCVLHTLGRRVSPSALSAVAVFLGGSISPNPDYPSSVGYYGWVASFGLLIVVCCLPAAGLRPEPETGPEPMVRFWRRTFFLFSAGWYGVGAWLWAWDGLPLAPFPWPCWLAAAAFCLACVLLRIGRGRCAAVCAGLGLVVAVCFTDVSDGPGRLYLTALWLLSSYPLLIALSLFQALAIESADPQRR